MTGATKQPCCALRRWSFSSADSMQSRHPRPPGGFAQQSAHMEMWFTHFGTCPGSKVLCCWCVGCCCFGLHRINFRLVLDLSLLSLMSFSLLSALFRNPKVEVDVVTRLLEGSLADELQAHPQDRTPAAHSVCCAACCGASALAAQSAQECVPEGRP